MQEKKSIILLVDDEPQIRKMLRIVLDSMGYRVEECGLGRQAVRLAASLKPDLVLLDLGLPDTDGKDVLKQLREWSQMPVVVLSVRDDDTEIVAALKAGADDYVTKPFNTEVLLARIEANLRKAAVREVGDPQLVNGPLRMDVVRHEVYVSDEKVSFTPREYELLRYLLVNRGRMLTHRQILTEVWGPAHAEDTQYLRVYVGQIREKLEQHPALNGIVVTEPGIGYRMENAKTEPPAQCFDVAEAS